MEAIYKHTPKRIIWYLFREEFNKSVEFICCGKKQYFHYVQTVRENDPQYEPEIIEGDDWEEWHGKIYVTLSETSVLNENAKARCRFCKRRVITKVKTPLRIILLTQK